MKSFVPGLAAVLLAAATLPVKAQPISYTILNPSMTATGGVVDSWSLFQGTGTHQPSIDSPGDPNPGSGSLLFTFNASAASITQDTGLTASGQALRGFSVDLAHDGTLLHLIIGFYEADPVWDIFLDPVGGFKEAIVELAVPGDTDGTLDSFTTVNIPTYTVNSAGHAIYLYVGTSATGAYDAPVGAKIAIDNVRLEPDASVADWILFD